MRRNTPGAPTPGVAIEGEGDRRSLAGALDIRTLQQARAALDAWAQPRGARVLDLARLDRLDTSGALLLCELAGQQVELAGVREEHRRLIDLVGALEHEPLEHPRAPARWRQLLMQIGRSTAEFRHDCIALVVFIGRTLAALRRALLHPRQLRPAAISRQISETGINALPIVALLAVMISVVIGYQSVIQLRPPAART